MIRRLLRATVLLALVVVVSSAVPALAAPVSLAESTVFVQFYPEEQAGSASMVAYVTLPDNVRLPATVRIPIPKGAEPFWVGEVFGSDLSDVVDKEREYEVVEGDGGPAVEFTVEETRTARYEATTGPNESASGRYSVRWEWIQSEPAKDVQFSLILPASATLVEVQPPPFDAGLSGDRSRQLFVYSPARLESGETTTIAVSYSRAGQALPDVKEPGYQGPVPLWLLALFGITIVGLVVVMLRERNRRASMIAGEPAEDEAGSEGDDLEE